MATVENNTVVPQNTKQSDRVIQQERKPQTERPCDTAREKTPSRATLRYSKRAESRHLNKTLYTHVHNSIIHSSQTVEATYVSING